MVCKSRPDLRVNGLEAVWVETKLSQETILIGCFYKPPSALVNYWKLIDESIKKAANTPHKYFILGDFNTDYLNEPSPHLVDMLQLNHLSQVITAPTRYTDTSATCIDLIITSSKDTVFHTEVRPPICSDHCVPVAVLKNANKIEKTYKRLIYDYSSLDIAKLTNELQRIDWAGIASLPSIDDAAEAFSQQLLTITDICVRHKLITVRKDDAPWFTETIRLMIQNKNTIHRHAKRTNLATDWAAFRKARNELTSEIRRRKREYLSELDIVISQNQNIGTKKWWQLVKSFMKKKGYSLDEIPPIEYNGHVYYSNREKAIVFNRYFASQSYIEDSPDDPLPRIPRVESELNDIQLSQEEVKKVLQQLNSQKAVGPDKIHNKILSASREVITEGLTLLFNRCLNEGKFPLSWKIALVSPIFKKGNREHCNNYRPISLLSCIGKTLEKCVQQRTLTYLTQNELITPHQSGFIPGDSTVYHLLNLYHDLCSAMDNNNTAHAIFFDISKAFDRVWHRGLIHKLEAIGIRGKLLDWFRDYLSNRKQATVIKGEMSDYSWISAGVPQGSVLGPLLFIVYINDITLEIESTIKLFADDTSMYSFMEDLDQQATTLNSDLIKIREWALKWKVTFNKTKTELMVLSRKTVPPAIPLSFDNSVLVPTANHKHLGVFLQNNCKWDVHIKSIISKVTILTSCLRSFKYRLSRQALENMYKSFILPHFDFSDILWDNCTNELAQDLESLHLDAIRTIVGSVRGTSHAKLYAESGFTTLIERRRRHKIIMYHKIVNGLVPEYLSAKLPPLISDRNPYHLRRVYEREHQAWDIGTFKTSFFLSTTHLWNDLPEDMQINNSISKLKHFLSRNDPIIPRLFYHGNRFEQIVHCRLRLGMSDLHQDMVNRYISNDPSCQTCGHRSENAIHYLLHCPTYIDARALSINTLHPSQRTICILLNGDPSLSNELNTNIFQNVQLFIESSRRFPNKPQS